MAKDEVLYEMLAGVNIHAPVIELRHEDLKRVDEDKPWRSLCPACKVGILAVRRDQNNNYRIMKDDWCLLCGQHVRYLTEVPDPFDPWDCPHSEGDAS